MTLSIRLPLPLENQLTMACERLNLSKSQVVQNALKTWLANTALTPPSIPQPHPLLAFVEMESNTAIANVADTNNDKNYIPYSKEALRKKVLAKKAAV